MNNNKKEVCEPTTPYTGDVGNSHVYTTLSRSSQVLLNTYSIKELHQIIDKGVKQFASLQWQDSDEMFKELYILLAQ